MLPRVPACAQAVPVADRQLPDQLAQARDQRRSAGRQDLAALHVRDVGRPAFAKTDQRAARWHVADRKARAAPISPLFSVDRRQQAFRAHLADPPQAILEPALFRGDLRARVGVLRRAPAADAEIRAARRPARRRLAQDRNRARDVERAFALQRTRLDGFARQGALDEHDLAFGVAADPAPFGVERGNIQRQPLFQRSRNSRHAGACCAAIQSRSSAHSLA